MMCQGPGGANGVGKGGVHHVAAAGELVHHPLEHFPFAVKDPGTTGNIQQQALWRRGLFQSDDGRELLAPPGQFFQGGAVSSRIVRLADPDSR